MSILILTDDRAGNNSQAIGLANEIKQITKSDYETLNLNYGFLSFLPNFLLKFFPLCTFTTATKNKIKHLQKFPKIIISVGRRDALAAIYLKKESQNQSQIIQIMNPNLPYENFDLVILPKHDFKDKDVIKSLPKNIITTVGSLSKINDELIKEEQKKFSKIRKIKGRKIALLVGGNSKNGVFTKKSAKKLAKLSSKIAKNMDATLLILNSRRTGAKNSEIIKKNLRCKNIFFDWQEVKNNNPYLAILGLSDFFIVTGDSMSMCSECCATGKSTYIFSEKKLASKKHQRLHQELFRLGFAKSLREKTIRFKKSSGKKLQETTRIAKIIAEKFLNS